MLIDAIRFLLDHLPLLLLVSPLIFWAYRELHTPRQWRIAMIAVSALALIVSGVFLASFYPNATRYVWSAGRLAPAAAWVRGYRLYYPVGVGPVLVQMYGPVSAMVYVPAAMAHDPTVAIMIGAAINTLCYFLPAAWFLRRCGRGQSGAIILAAFAAFALISSRQFVLQMTATLVTIDAPAIGLATCAMAVMVAAPREKLGRAGAISGVFAALSAWTKLTTAPVVIALCVYALLIARPRDAVRFILCMAAAGIAVSGIFLLWFGTEMIFHNLIVPSRQPWEYGFLGRWRAYQRVLWLMWQYSLPASVIMIAAILLRPQWPGIFGDAGREWAAHNPWLLPLIAMIAIFPTSSLAYVKVGGIWNNAAACTYMALLTAVSSLLAASAPLSQGSLTRMNRIARVALASMLVLGCWIDAREWGRLTQRNSLWSSLPDNDHETAYRYAIKHPGQVYFPSYPLSTLLAEDKAYHFAAGIDDLDRAGFPLTDEHLRRELPQDLRAILIRAGAPRPPMLDRLPEFDQAGEVPDMPGWIVLTRQGNLP